jgi:hypothetical protein
MPSYDPSTVSDHRLLVWQIDDTDGFDSAWVEVQGSRMTAEGRAVGQRPIPWWTTYRLDTNDDFVTARVSVESRWAGGGASLELERTNDGWSVNGERRPDLDGALDCDLAACPLTNTMPVLRLRLLDTPGDHELVMAFIEVPALRVVPSSQRYTHVRTFDDGGAVITYRSDSFRSDLTFDSTGFVVDYPQLGRRIGPGDERPAPRERGGASG